MLRLNERYQRSVNLTRLNTFNNDVVIVDGQGRSGKNLISVLLSTMSKVEKMRLDSQIDYIPRYYFLGKMSLDAAVTALLTEFDEKYYYNSISRDVNFRLSDYSGVMKQGKRFEYIKRLFLPADAVAVDRLNKSSPIFQEMTHDGLHVATLYFLALKKRLKLIHVFRDPLGNIYEQNVRGFGERIGVDPRELQLTHEWEGNPVPIIVNGCEDDYLAGNSLERLVLMVNQMFRLNMEGFHHLSSDEKKQVMFIEFEDFVVNPFPYMSRLEKFIGQPFGAASKRILRRENCPRVINTLDRENRINSILDGVNEKYKSIFINLLEDYAKKPWLNFSI